MTSKWYQRRLLPRGLLARSVLILIVALAVVLSVVIMLFVDRIYKNETIFQSTDTVRQINLILQTRSAQDDLAKRLGFEFAMIDETLPPSHLRRFYDLSGRYVIGVFASQLDLDHRIDLATKDAEVSLYVSTGTGVVKFQFARNRLSPNNPHQLLIWTIMASLVIFILAFIVLRQQIRPILDLSKAAEAFGRGEKRDYAPQGAIELRQAGHAFLSMRARIERQLEQRQNMLSGVSHDLRTPLTRMKLSLGLLEDEEHAALLAGDIGEMQMIINEFLNFAKTDQNEESVEISAIKLLKSIIKDRARAQQQLDLKIGLKSGETDSFIGREVAIRRAVDNLLNNAFKHANHVQLSLQKSGDTLKIMIDDDGPGIAPDQIKDALKPFIRLDSARTRSADAGSGLGLAIAADIARRHGGRLSLSESQNLGGLCATLNLPTKEI